MATDSHSVIADEIDAIVARAMSEYYGARGQEPPAPITPEPVEENTDVLNAITSDDVVPVENTIPENSESIFISETTSRFSGAVWYDKIQEKRVLLAGLGGIGSYVAFLLGRMNVAAMYIYDDDTVEAGNMSGQHYSRADIGVHKAQATSNILANFCSYYSTYVYSTRFTRDTGAMDIMICGFDNMEARKTFFDSWKRHVDTVDEKDKCLFIDGRLAAESFQVLCIKGDDDFNINKYNNEYLFSDEEADETICSYKQTSFMANMIGSVIVNLFTNFVANQCDPLVPRDLPFLTEYTAETMYFKVTA